MATVTCDRRASHMLPVSNTLSFANTVSGPA